MFTKPSMTPADLAQALCEHAEAAPTAKERFLLLIDASNTLRERGAAGAMAREIGRHLRRRYTEILAAGICPSCEQDLPAGATACPTCPPT